MLGREDSLANFMLSLGNKKSWDRWCEVVWHPWNM